MHIRITTIGTLLLLFFLTAYSNYVKAQTNKGEFIIGGVLGASRYTNLKSFNPTSNKFDTKSTTQNLGISPNIYYFFAPNLAIGIHGSLSYFRQSYVESILIPLNNSTTYYELGPAIRYYFNLDSKFSTFLNFNYELGYNTQKIINPVTNLFIEKDPKYDRRTFNGGVGMVYFLFPSVGLEGILNYTNRRDTRNDFHFTGWPTTTQRIGLNIGIRFHLNQTE